MCEETNTEVAAQQTSKPRGRPLAFNQDDALESALQVFWLRGYEGASMAELVDALGINKPSIYAAFGNKEALFRKALAKYLAGPVAFIESVMHERTARKVAEKFLTGAAEFLTDHKHPMGCMIVQAALTCGKGSELIQQELIAYRKNLESSFEHRFELAKSQGDLPPDVQSADLAKYLATLHQGMSVQATSGASRDELLAIVKLALKNWPTNE
ncbi:MAG: TetR/AcrR family transcriptional regulator [Pseudomonadota bacterium]